MKNDNAYTPVAYDYREVIQEHIEKQTSGKIFFWSTVETVEDISGRAITLQDLPGKGMFVILHSGAQIRIDRIITFFGKPGAAYDEYDAFANECLACTAGVPL